MRLEAPPLCARAPGYAARIALVDGAGKFTYSQLEAASHRAAETLLGGRADLREERIAFLAPPGVEWVVAQWGIWRAGGIAVPLAMSHPAPELARVVEDSGASTVIVHPRELHRVAALASRARARIIATDQLTATNAANEGIPQGRSDHDIAHVVHERRASILYTSGTTGRPKGVVATHGNVAAAIETLVDAWGWSASDRILHVLPLHHVHGIINVLSCALWCGATCEFLPRFEASEVWDRLASGEITLFMAVPTMYHRLIAAWEEATESRRRTWSEGASRLRLMVSGSAALPVSTLTRWREITGHTLLERYGMTEIGMALSNPLHGERVAGTVGVPLPGVEARLVDGNGRPVPPGGSGEIEIRGPQVFLEYWGRTADTAEAFRDGWFRTGDEATIDNGRWRILGRSSIDILKTAGYKVSALEIEEVLRTHPDVADIAVVGVPDEDLGERVAAAIVARPQATLDAAALLHWARERLAPYKVPRAWKLVADLPRNAMGKIMKPEVKTMFESDLA